MLIAEEVNATSLARSWLRQAASGLTVAGMREKLRLEATTYAEGQVAKYLPQLKRALKKDELLPPAYRQQGLRFTEDGYPDFSPYAVNLPNGQKSVKIELTGKHETDVGIANRAAGIHGGTPRGYTWHHHQDGTTMELVPRNLHENISHTGGRSHYRDRTGVKSAYSK